MRAKFTYKVPDEDYQRAKIEERGTGDLGFWTSEWSGECLALSEVYVCVLRAQRHPEQDGQRVGCYEGGHH